MLGPCFDMQYLVAILVLQSSRWGSESRLLYVLCLFNVRWLILFLPFAHGAVDWSAVYDCHTHVLRIGHIFELLKN